MSRTGFRGVRRPKLSTGRRLSAIDGIRLDVLRGRGTADVRLASVGAEELAFGEFVATGIIRVTTDGCTDGESSEPVPGEDGGPFHEVRELQMFRVSGGERVLGRFAPEMLDSQPVKLRLAGVPESATCSLATSGAACSRSPIRAPPATRTIRLRRRGCRGSSSLPARSRKRAAPPSVRSQRAARGASRPRRLRATGLRRCAAGHAAGHARRLRRGRLQHHVAAMQPARPAAFGIDGRLGDGAVISCGRVVVEACCTELALTG